MIFQFFLTFQNSLNRYQGHSDTSTGPEKRLWSPPNDLESPCTRAMTLRWCTVTLKKYKNHDFHVFRRSGTWVWPGTRWDRSLDSRGGVVSGSMRCGIRLCITPTMFIYVSQCLFMPHTPPHTHRHRQKSSQGRHGRHIGVNKK